MTSRRKFKKLVRAHAAKTGKNYTAALRSFLVQSDEGIEMTTVGYELEQLLWSANCRAQRDNYCWVGVEHILLELAESQDGSGSLAKFVPDLQTAIAERDRVERRTESIHATEELTRLAQLLTFQRQFVPGGVHLTLEKIVQSAMKSL